MKEEIMEEYNEQANIMEENDNHSETLEDVSWSGWETDSETGEVLWDDKTLAWFDKWGVADEV